VNTKKKENNNLCAVLYCFLKKKSCLISFKYHLVTFERELAHDNELQKMSVLNVMLMILYFIFLNNYYFRFARFRLVLSVRVIRSITTHIHSHRMNLIVIRPLFSFFLLVIIHNKKCTTQKNNLCFFLHYYDIFLSYLFHNNVLFLIRFSFFFEMNHKNSDKSQNSKTQESYFEEYFPCMTLFFNHSF